MNLCLENGHTSPSSCPGPRAEIAGQGNLVPLTTQGGLCIPGYRESASTDTMVLAGAARLGWLGLQLPDGLSARYQVLAKVSG
jgi:hypothetical protein